MTYQAFKLRGLKLQASSFKFPGLRNTGCPPRLTAPPRSHKISLFNPALLDLPETIASILVSYHNVRCMSLAVPRVSRRICSQYHGHASPRVVPIISRFSIQFLCSQKWVIVLEPLHMRHGVVATSIYALIRELFLIRALDPSHWSRISRCLYASQMVYIPACAAVNLH